MRGGYLHTQRVFYEILSSDKVCGRSLQTQRVSYEILSSDKVCGRSLHTQRVSYEIFSGDRCVEDIFILRGCPMKYLVVAEVWRISSYTEGVL